MTQTQTETSISNGRRRARTPAEILGEAFFASESEQPKETQHYVWMGLNHEEVFYTLRADNLSELETAAERFSDCLNVNWTVKFLISSGDYDNVPIGLAAHKLVSEDSGRTGRNSFLALRNSLLEHGRIEREGDEGYMPKRHRMSRYHS